MNTTPVCGSFGMTPVAHGSAPATQLRKIFTLDTPTSSSTQPLTPIAPCTLLAPTSGASICPNGIALDAVVCCTCSVTGSVITFAVGAAIVMVAFNVVDPPMTLPGFTMLTVNCPAPAPTALPSCSQGW